MARPTITISPHENPYGWLATDGRGHEGMATHPEDALKALFRNTFLGAQAQADKETE